VSLERRYLLQGISVLLFTVANSVAISMVDAGDARPVLILSGIGAVAAAVHVMVWGTEALTPALLLSLPPLLMLGGGEGVAWLIAPLASLLLLASELAVTGWELRDVNSHEPLLKRRLTGAGFLAGGGTAASLLVMAVAGAGPSLGGTAAVVLAAGALAALGWVLFGAS
jgi:hypothetical protein